MKKPLVREAVGGYRGVAAFASLTHVRRRFTVR
jgi:hypothetical protein